MHLAPRYITTVTAHVDPPLEDALRLLRRVLEQHAPDADPVMASAGDRLPDGAEDAEPHLASWTVLLGPADSDGPVTSAAALHRHLRDAVLAEGSSFRLEELDVLTSEQLARAARARDRAQLVGVDEFCQMLARPGASPMSTSRFWELAGGEDFPAPVRPGRWTRHQAEEYARRPRRGPGRPARDTG